MMQQNWEREGCRHRHLNDAVKRVRMWKAGALQQQVEDLL